MFHGVRILQRWQLKTYTILAPHEEPNTDTMESALTFLDEQSTWPTDLEPGYGFIVIHVGTEAVWLLLDLWANDILRHFLFFAPTESPASFEPGPSNGTMACAWELEVFKHERDSWVRHVLSKPSKPDLQLYLNDGLTIEPG